MAADLSFSLAASAKAPREARRRIEILPQLAPRALAEAQLVITELLTNSLIHGPVTPTSQIDVAVHLTDTHLIIEVDDHGAFTRATHTTPRGPGGRGLQLLEAICESWDANHGHVTATINLTRYPTEPGRGVPR